MRHVPKHGRAPALLLSALLATPVAAQAPADEPMEIQYGTVEAIDVIMMEVNFESGAAIGGGAGAAATTTASTYTMLGVAAVGAVVGASVQKRREAEYPANLYIVRLADGTSMKIASEHHELVVGDCLAVEDGRYVNIRPVADDFCREGDDTPSYETLHRANLTAARDCEQAQQRVLDATTKAEREQAHFLMRVACAK